MSESFISLNARLNLLDENGKLQLDADKQAAREYFLQHINRRTKFSHTLKERLDYLVEEGYYDGAVLNQYDYEFVKSLHQRLYAHKFRFPTFISAYKFYTQYALKDNQYSTNPDDGVYLERYEDRIAIVALALARGSEEDAIQYAEEMITGRYQPATPTFLNMGRAQRGEPTSCYLMSTSDNMESIARNITNSLQLSRRGGGVAVNLTDLREVGAPIKNIAGQSSGVVPVMKLLEDSFSYADQLGSRQGAGAAYLHAHHPDIMRFLDTKRENADEKVRIKTLSIGVVIPDITFELAKGNKDMYLFSPYDVKKVYGKPFSEVDITAEYHNLVDNPDIRKSKISARRFFLTLAELQFESGYPYIMFADTATRANPLTGTIKMSNLCTEILQPQSDSTYNMDGTYNSVGEDISCNLGSLNIANVMDGGDLETTARSAIRALTSVSEQLDVECVPSINEQNKKYHAVGLGQMNLHGFLAREGLHYDSEEARDWFGAYMAAMNYYTLKASCELAKENGVSFEGFEDSKYANGAYFSRYLDKDWHPTTDAAKNLFAKFGVVLPTREDWAELSMDVQIHGLYNSHRQAVAPTGSISYVSNSTSSIHPVVSPIEVRKEGKMGRVYSPAPYLSEETLPYYTNAYEVGPEPIIDMYAVAGPHVDQGLSLTLFFKDTATTRDVNRAQIYAWSRGHGGDDEDSFVKTLYYIRVRQSALDGTDVEGCASCML